MVTPNISCYVLVTYNISHSIGGRMMDNISHQGNAENIMVNLPYFHNDNKNDLQQLC